MTHTVNVTFWANRPTLVPEEKIAHDLALDILELLRDFDLEASVLVNGKPVKHE